MRNRLLLILWALASLAWLSWPFWCDIFGGGGQLISCRDARGLAISALTPGAPHPEWLSTSFPYLIWIGPPFVALFLFLVVRWVFRTFRHND